MSIATAAVSGTAAESSAVVPATGASGSSVVVEPPVPPRHRYQASKSAMSALIALSMSVPPPWPHWPPPSSALCPVAMAGTPRPRACSVPGRALGSPRRCSSACGSRGPSRTICTHLRPDSLYASAAVAEPGSFQPRRALSRGHNWSSKVNDNQHINVCECKMPIDTHAKSLT